MELHLFQGLIQPSWTLLMNLVTIVVLYLILKKYFFERVREFMIARENAVRDAFDSAESTNRLADERLDNYNKQISNIEAEGREIIKNAKVRSDAQAKEILDEAEERAEQIKRQARQDIEREKLKALSEMKEHIAALSLMAAEKIMEKQLDSAGQDEIVNRIIEEAGTEGWQR